MFEFIFTLKTDSGKFKIKTIATSLKTAKSIIMNSENCPEQAILSIKTKKIKIN